MGKPMAKNLLARGLPRRRAQPQRGPGGGARRPPARPRAASPAEVARRATRIVTMLPDRPDVEQVLEGPDGVFGAMQPGTIVIDMSTIAPSVAQRLAERARQRSARGCSMRPSAAAKSALCNATLSIMVGGDERRSRPCKPILHAMGNPDRVVHIGESGAGQICKVCNQMVIGGTLAAVGEAFALARKAGVDAARVREALLGGFAASRVLEVHGERILEGQLQAGISRAPVRERLSDRHRDARGAQTPAPVSGVVHRPRSLLRVTATMITPRSRPCSSVSPASALRQCEREARSENRDPTTGRGKLRPGPGGANPDLAPGRGPGRGRPRPDPADDRGPTRCEAIVHVPILPPPPEEPAAERTEPAEHVVHVAEVDDLDQVAVEVLARRRTSGRAATARAC